jgi:uncharacterized protein (TIGR03435 family)
MFANPARAALYILISLSTMQAQSFSFEVASIKPTRLVNAGVRAACHGIDSHFGPDDPNAGIPLGRCVITSGRLGHMIGVAYGLSMDMVIGQPDWMAGGDRFDLEAKVEDPRSATESQLLSALRSLLSERFNLKFHRETREMPGFALVVAKGGPKMQESREDEERKPVKNPVKPEGESEALKKGGAEGAPRMIAGQKTSMSDLIRILTPLVHAHILDETHLTGLYDFKLQFEAGESISGPLQDQLGLRLENRRVPVLYFIIDSAERPTQN